MKNLIKKLGGAWYLKEVFWGLLWTTCGLVYGTMPFWPGSQPQNLTTWVITVGMSVLSIVLGVNMLRYAMGLKGLEEPIDYSF